MTITDEILITANILANAGKKPTVALIKAKLAQQAPLPLLITTLKGWQHQPNFIAVTNEADTTTSNHLTDIKNNLCENHIVKSMIQEIVVEELKPIKTELSDIKKLIETLNEQLKAANKS